MQRNLETSLGFLIAPPSLDNPIFASSLVLMVAHDESGATGFVINRASPFRLFELLEELEIKPGLKGDRDVLSGGPVSEHTGFVLYEHPANQPLGPGFKVTDSISVSPSLEVLAAAAEGKINGRFELLLGYAGWGPEQLDEELKRGGWMHSAFDEALLFDVQRDDRWSEAYARLGVDLAGYVTVKGGAQA